MSLDDHGVQPLSPGEQFALADLERLLDGGDGVWPEATNNGQGAPPGVVRAAVAIAVSMACLLIGLAAVAGGLVFATAVAAAFASSAIILTWLIRRNRSR
jgi:hypothetical protein